MAPDSAVAAFQAAARRLGDHPQDHGWRELYRLFAAGLAGGQAPRLAAVVSAARSARPDSGDEHLVTLVGIALRLVADAAFPGLTGSHPVETRLATLERLLATHGDRIVWLVTQRQNSFTSPRRFLVSQLLLARYFNVHQRPARVADLGTGLGVLPRQLNSARVFTRFASDLQWPDGVPPFRPIPLQRRYGVDRGPLPDLDWVRACYGPSAYYDERFQELLEVLALPEVAGAEVELVELDFTDPAALREFLTEHRINAVNLCYTLYEIPPPERGRVLSVLRDTLPTPGLIIVTEPNQDLARSGCVVSVHDTTQPAIPWQPVCTVSDGHFRGGRVERLAGYHEFLGLGSADSDERGADGPSAAYAAG